MLLSDGYWLDLSTVCISHRGHNEMEAALHLCYKAKTLFVVVSYVFLPFTLAHKIVDCHCTTRNMSYHAVVLAKRSVRKLILLCKASRVLQGGILETT